MQMRGAVPGSVLYVTMGSESHVNSVHWGITVFYG